VKYLEVKLDTKSKEMDMSSFVSNIIKKQETLNTEYTLNTFDSKKLEKLGFIYNLSTNGYSLQKNFSIEEIESYARNISKLKYHILTHGYIIIKIYKDILYFWDTALIFEGIDTFEYCLKNHNIFKLDGLHVVTKSSVISGDILELCNYTKRYGEPSLDYIIDGYYWDKKLEKKVKKSSIEKPFEYIKNY